MEKLTDKTSSMDALLESESDESGSDAESFEQPYEPASDALLNRLNRVRIILWALLRQIEGLSSKIEEVTKNKSEDEGDNALKLEKRTSGLNMRRLRLSSQKSSKMKY